MHKNDDFVPPSSPSLKYYKELQIIDDEFPPVVKEKKKYPRKVGRFECDLCGRILKTNRSLSQHLLLHSKSYQFVCEVSFIKILILILLKYNFLELWREIYN